MGKPASSPLLEARSVSRRFGSHLALRRLNFRIFSGNFIALFGPNGAGKSTLLRILAGLHRPSSGLFQFSQSSGRRPEIGYVSHSSLLYPELSGRENLLFYARLFQLNEPADRASSMLRRLALDEAGDRAVKTYSRGMRQRLTLARALIHEPTLLLLDEPYSGLDQAASRLLSEILLQLKARSRTIVMATHNLNEGLSFADRVMVLKQGRLALDEETSSLNLDGFEDTYFSIIGAA